MPVPFKMLDGSDPIPPQMASGNSSYINDSVFNQGMCCICQDSLLHFPQIDNYPTCLTAPQFAKTHVNSTTYKEPALRSHTVPSTDDEIDLL
jgi:hypothetical protein